MVDKSSDLKRYIDGEILTASDLNTSHDDVGPIQYLVPYNSVFNKDSAGVVFLGTTAFSFGGIVLKAGYKFLESDGVNTTEITFGSGGGGGLDPIALANQFSKLGTFYPLPTAKHTRNAFTDSSYALGYLRTAYGTGDAATILLDIGLDSELSTVRAMNLTAEWINGAGTGLIISSDTSLYLSGTSAIKMTTPILDGTMDIYTGTSLSYVGRNIRVSAYPDTLTNVQKLFVIAYTSDGNHREYAFGTGVISAGQWNHLTCDNTDSSAYTDTGTFIEGQVERVYLGATTLSAQTLNVTWDTYRAVSDKPALVEDYGLSMVIQNNTTQEVVTLTDEDETDNTSKGSYTMGTTLLNNYTTNDATNYIATTTGTVSNNEMTHKATASGQSAKTAKRVESLLLPTTSVSGTLEAFARFHHEAYKVTAFPDTTTIEIESVTTDKSGYFKDNDWILLFKKERVGDKDGSMEGSHTVNFLRLQLGGDATYSDPTITLTNDGSNSVGSDTSNYYVIPESVAMSYVASTKTNSTFAQMTPTELLVNGGNKSIFLDNFNRTNSATVGNGWSQFTSTTGGGTYGIVGNKFGAFVTDTNNRGGYVIYRSLENYNIESLEITGSFIKKRGVFDQMNTNFSVAWGATPASSFDASWHFWDDYTSGLYFNYDEANATTSATFKLGDADGIGASLVVTELTDDVNYQFRIQKLGTRRMRFKYWLTSASEPIAWTLEWQKPSDFNTANRTQLCAAVSAANATATDDSYMYMDDLQILNLTSGYTLKYKQSSLTNIDKMETITTLSRQDTTNQAPSLYETGALLY